MNSKWKNKENGLTPTSNSDAHLENGILFWVEYYIARHYDDASMDELMSIEQEIEDHMAICVKDGVYLPKMSHDNNLAFIALEELTGIENPLSFMTMVKSSGWHPKDIILYCIMHKSSKMLNVLGAILSPMLILFVLVSILGKGKVRPVFWDENHTMNYIKVWCRKYESKISWIERDRTYTKYKFKEGEFTKIQMQNDGKILNPLKLIILSKKNILMKGLAKVCHYVLSKRYGKYMSVFFGNYFVEQDHPIRIAWNKLEDKDIYPLDL